MRQLATALVVTLLMGASPGVAAAQTEPSPTMHADGQRFEVSGFGYAVTLPPDWLGIATTEPDVEGLLATVADRLSGPEEIERLTGLLSQMAAPIASGAQVVATPIHAGPSLFCGTEARYGPPGPLADWVERVAANARAGRGGIAAEDGPESIELASGPAWVLDGTIGDPASGSGVYTTMYMLGGEGLELGVSCYGYERSPEVWLAFVEGIEFLPVEG